MDTWHGHFVFYELMTRSPDAASAFYTQVLDWTIPKPAVSGEESPGEGETGEGAPGMDYRFIQVRDDQRDDSHTIGGVLGLTDAMCEGGAMPTWMGYVAVQDIDESCAKVSEAGGQVLMPIRDIPEAGRIAMIADPQGLPLYLIEPRGEGPSYAFAWDRPRVGHCAWNELHAIDRHAALDFYAGLFGWVKDGEMPLGPDNSYDFLRHEVLIGAMLDIMACDNGTEYRNTAGWRYYFRVADIDAAVERINTAGGKVDAPPMEIPGGDFALHAHDPEGVQFSIVGARRSTTV